MNAPAATELPVVVIGAGPAGLAAAAHLIERGIEPAGPGSRTRRRRRGARVGTRAAVLHLGRGHRPRRREAPRPHRLDPPRRRRLPRRPATGPSCYLQPLADVLGDRVRYRRRASPASPAPGGTASSTPTARPSPSLVHIAHAGGGEERLFARAVIDASGTWATPSPAGGSGLPALGEKAAADRITYRVPDLKDPAVRARYAGRRTAVIGSGASAFTALAHLADLAKPTTARAPRACGSCAAASRAPPSAAAKPTSSPRAAPWACAAKAAVDDGHADAVTGFRTEAIERGARWPPDPGGRGRPPPGPGRRGHRADRLPPRPVLPAEELRLGLDERLQAPVALAPLIDPNQHSCGTVHPHGRRELSHPEQGVYLVGMKSYGRAPTFLAMTGYEQVRSVAAAIAGDLDAADRVELTLPETGVCGGAGLFDAPDAAEGDSGGCCAPAPQLVQLGVPAAAEAAAAEEAQAGGCCGS